MIHWPLYQLTPEKAVDQFRYWVTTNRHNHELMLTFFNILNDNKLVKEGGKLILDSIATNLKLYLPMLTKELTFAESDSYDSMTDAMFTDLSASLQESISDNATFHASWRQYDPSTHVKVRLLSN